MFSLVNATRMCQVCKKLFPNGKALGGHLRSHTRTQKRSFPSHRCANIATSSTMTPLQASNRRVAANVRASETVLVRSVHTSEAIFVPKPDLKEEGGQEITTGKRKFPWDLNEVCPTESQSSLTAEEQAATSLLDLSEVNKWPENVEKAKLSDGSVSTRKGKEVVEYIEIVDSDDEVDEVDEDDEESYYRYLDRDDDNKREDVKILTSEVKKEDHMVIEDKDEDEEEDQDDELYLVAKETKCRKRYRCDLCGKVLRSYQALGGHRTSHRNKRLKMLLEKNEEDLYQPNGAMVRRHFECEICGKVFTSGQALGGHKKIHYMFLKPVCN